VGTSPDDERSLIEAARADPARFLELYDRHVDRVYGYVSRRAGNRVVAEDITSAVFEQALANLPKFEWRGAPFAAWLFRIAANALADHWRREGRGSPDPPPDGRTNTSIAISTSASPCSSWSIGCLRPSGR
jgi:RNA polymerase sigma factor (sigma-70 family)